MIFLLNGLKYEDRTVKVMSEREGMSSAVASPAAICENTAPDMIKKKPA